jgi:uncharacterized protein YlxW (UPF0749 family)
MTFVCFAAAGMGESPSVLWIRMQLNANRNSLVQQEARMDDEARAQIADILRILTEIQQQLTTLAEQLGVSLD